MCVWGHPTTTGLLSMDYFISSDAYHIDTYKPYLQNVNKNNEKVKNKDNNNNNNNNDNNYEENNTNKISINIIKENTTNYNNIIDSKYKHVLPINSQIKFEEQLIRLDSLGFYFDRPLQGMFFLELEEHSSEHSSGTLEEHSSLMEQSFDEKESLESSLEGLTLPPTTSSTSPFTTSIKSISTSLFSAMVNQPNFYLTALENKFDPQKKNSFDPKKKSVPTPTSKKEQEEKKGKNENQKIYFPKQNETISLHEIIELKKNGFSLILCPQHLPKFHTDFDIIIKNILDGKYSLRTYEFYPTLNFY